MGHGELRTRGNVSVHAAPKNGGARVTPADDATVFVIDDDARMRAATQRLLKSVGLHAETFATPQDFLRRKLPDGPSCLVLDVRLPGMSGLDVQRKLSEAGVPISLCSKSFPDGSSRENSQCGSVD